MKKLLLFLFPAFALATVLNACSQQSSASIPADTSSTSSVASADVPSQPGDASNASSDAAAVTDPGSPATGADISPTSTDSSSAALSAAEASSPQANLGQGKTVTVNMIAENFDFKPNIVKAHKGDKLVIHLTGVSGNHGFMVEALGINVAIPLGQTKDIVIPTDQAGTFEFRCSVPCGTGHRDMTGQIVIS